MSKLTRYQKYYRENREKVKAKSRAYRTAHREEVNRKVREYLQEKRKDAEFCKQDAERVHRYRQRLRTEVLEHYGAFCVCCGENTSEFLCIDHIHGGGCQHRKQIGGNSTTLYAWIRRHGFPDDFRVLCHNCNSSLGLYGYCPHNGEGVRAEVTHLIAQKHAQQLRTEILTHYGAHCACCGNDYREFLCLDHINGGGVRHRQAVGGNSISVYRWVKKNNFPDDFRVLCHNCNQSLGLYGYCSHQKAES